MIRFRELSAGTALCGSLLFCAPPTAGAAVIFVNLNATGSKPDGKTWATAFLKILDGYAVGVKGDEVWVARGEYKERVTLRDGVCLFGGFAVTETARTQRPLTQLSLTVLNGTQSGTVITAPRGVNSDTVVDGFHIINGNAKDGGGFICDGSYPQISNCWFSNNTADAGGAIFCTNNAAPDIDFNTFEANSAKNGGGAIHVQGAFPGISGNVFLNNTTTATDSLHGFGGAVLVDQHGSPNIVLNVFRGNHANYGGAISENIGFNTIGNNLFDRNSAAFQGGAIAYEASQVYIVANTIAGNTAPQGGALAQTLVSPVFASSLYNNAIALNSSGLYGDGVVGATTNYIGNDVFGNGGADWTNLTDPTGANGNIKADPLFVDTANGDYHLMPGSPAIDAGDRFGVTSATDLDGNPRVRGAYPDIGAYEAMLPAYTVTDLARALRLAGGLETATHDDIRRLNLVDGVNDAFSITVLDAVGIARKITGLENNP